MGGKSPCGQSISEDCTDNFFLNNENVIVSGNARVFNNLK